jgi:hypothetical protein
MGNRWEYNLQNGAIKGWKEVDRTTVQDRDVWWHARNMLISLGVSQHAEKFKYLKNCQFLKKNSDPWVSDTNKLILHFLIFGTFSKKILNEESHLMVQWDSPRTSLWGNTALCALLTSAIRYAATKEQTTLHINTATYYNKNVNTFNQLMRNLDRFATHGPCFYAQNQQ